MFYHNKKMGICFNTQKKAHPLFKEMNIKWLTVQLTEHASNLFLSEKRIQKQEMEITKYIVYLFYLLLATNKHYLCFKEFTTVLEQF